LIPKPGLDTMHEEQLLDDGHILSGGLVIEADLTAGLREGGQLAGVVSKNLQQSRHLGEFVQVGDVSDVPFYNRLDVVACPSPATLFIFSPKHLRITANQHRAYKTIAYD